ncbi:unnamed protein product [Spirodela intermedia]|uniref:Uncharacterized protein n=1 Tax=Spirodela intermedia TaxID=51605 RepID=A0A7I8JZT1_SPIIN|nr:unnamed protein product [Spirodela intermedia]
MEVRLLSSTTVDGGGPSATPLSAFDKVAADMHVAVLFAFAAPTATNAQIKDGLAKTLAHFYTFAGRLGTDELRRPCILAGGAGNGALLVEAAVESELAEQIPLKPSPELQKLHRQTEGAVHALQVQLNRFRCGGLVIGVTCHHRVADGQSMSTFYAAWGRAVRGLAVHPLPVYDCRRWLQPRRLPRSEFIPPGQAQKDGSLPPPPAGDEDVHNLSLHYSGEFIAKALKEQTMEKYTTFEILLAHLWRKITMARGLNGEEFTQVRVAVDGRRRLTPPVPAEFTGNMVLNAYPRAGAKELLGGGLEGAAALIRAAVRRTGEEYFRSFVDFWEIHKEQELLNDWKEMVLYPDLEVNSWLGFRFSDMEFGGGEGGVCAFAPSWIPAEGVIVFIPLREGDGGVDVVVTLFESHAKLLRQISHSVD